MAGNVIEIKVKTDDQTGPGMDSVEKRSGKLKATLGRVSETAAGFIGANVISTGFNAFKNMIGGSIEAASDLGESLNAVTQIFGDSSKVILDWGKKNSASFGLSQKAFNELATPLGAMLKNSGLSMQDTTKWTIDLTKRASDMASVFNTDVTDALEAIQAGMRGESDPLEKYGVGLSAAKVEAEALAETHKKAAKELTDTEKATARLNIIMKQTSSVEGDFRNTADGLANSTRIQEATMQNLQAQIGQKLLPAKLALTRAEAALAGIIVSKVMPVLDRLQDWFQKHPQFVKAAAIAVGVVLVGAFIAWAVAAASAAAATIAATWPIMAVIAACAALVAGLVYAYTHWKAFRDAANLAAQIFKNNVWPVLKTVAEWLGKAFVHYIEVAAYAWIQFARFGLNALGAILNAAASAFGWIPGLGPKLKSAAAGFTAFKDKVNGVLGAMSKDLKIRITADTRPVDNSLAALRARLVKMSHSVLTIPIHAGEPGQGQYVYKAGGGIVGAAAGGGIRNNRIIVGEHGPELVDLPSGSNVHSNPDMVRMLLSGGNSRVELVIDSAGSAMDDFLLELLRKAIRLRGGNVQQTLGQ